MVKVTQLRGHRGAKCFFFQMGGCLQPCSYHPARRFVYQHLFKFPASSFPSRSPFSAPVCSVSFPFSIRPSSLSLLASLTHSLCLPFTRPSPCLSPSYRAISYGIGAFGGPWGRQAQASLALCPVAVAGRVGKGQRREAQQPNWNWGPARVGKETRKQGTWGQRVWVSGGQRLRRSGSRGHSRLCGQIWG